MALVNLMKKVSFTCTISSLASSSLLPASFASINVAPVRTYLANFFNDKTAIKPRFGWMHQNRGLPPGNKVKKMRLYDMKYSEIKRQRKISYEARMKTEGGRKIIMKKILMGKDHMDGFSP